MVITLLLELLFRLAILKRYHVLAARRITTTSKQALLTVPFMVVKQNIAERNMRLLLRTAS